MTQLEWQQLEATVAGMTAEEKQRLATLLSPSARKLSDSGRDPSIGLFADEPELIDELMDFVYASREARQLHTGQ